jgi:hypothetical protein
MVLILIVYLNVIKCLNVIKSFTELEHINVT